MKDVEPSAGATGRSKKGSETRIAAPKRFFRLVRIHWLHIAITAGVVALFVVAGWGTYRQGYDRANKMTTVQKAKVADLTGQLDQMQVKISAGDYLSIKQWGIRLPLTTPIGAATYTFQNSNGWDGHQTAFLSTATMDNSPVCQQFFATDPNQPTFQWVTRYSPTDTITPAEAPGNPIAASSAVQQWPADYRLVNGYVYAFGQGTGSSCPEEAIDMQGAFRQAFKDF